MVQVWDRFLDAKLLEYQFPRDSNAESYARISADARFIAWAGYIYDAKTKSLLETKNGETLLDVTLMHSMDLEKSMLATSDYRSGFVNLQILEPQYHFVNWRWDSHIVMASLNTDATHIIGATVTGEVFVVNAETQKITKSWKPYKISSWLRFFSGDPIYKIFFLPNKDQYVIRSRSSTDLYDFATHKRLHSFDSCGMFQYSKNGQWLLNQISCDNTPRYQLINSNTMDELVLPIDHELYETSISPNGEYLATVDEKDNIKIYKLNVN